jgi:hypothetical protein
MISHTSPTTISFKHFKGFLRIPQPERIAAIEQFRSKLIERRDRMREPHIMRITNAYARGEQGGADSALASAELALLSKPILDPIDAIDSRYELLMKQVNDLLFYSKLLDLVLIPDGERAKLTAFLLLKEDEFTNPKSKSADDTPYSIFGVISDTIDRIPAHATNIREMAFLSIIAQLEEGATRKSFKSWFEEHFSDLPAREFNIGPADLNETDSSPPARVGETEEPAARPKRTNPTASVMPEPDFSSLDSEGFYAILDSFIYSRLENKLPEQEPIQTIYRSMSLAVRSLHAQFNSVKETVLSRGGSLDAHRELGEFLERFNYALACMSILTGSKSSKISDPTWKVTVLSGEFDKHPNTVAGFMGVLKLNPALIRFYEEACKLRIPM